MKSKSYRGFLWILFLPVLAGAISSYCKVDNLKILEFDFVATTTGVLLGFGITIYTFIMQLMQPIIDNLCKKIADEKERKRNIGFLNSAQRELKQDLWMIFICLMIVLVVGVFSNSVNLIFNFGVHHICYIPQTVYISVYLLSFMALYDLMSSLFTVGEITIELLNTDEIKPKSPTTTNELS